MVRSLLSTAGADASRPEDMDPRDGLKDDGYQLSDAQAQEILAMRLQRLTGLEQEKLADEYRQVLDTIRGLIEILQNPDRLLAVIRGELETVKAEFGDVRRTEIQHSKEDLNVLDLIAAEDMVVTLSHTGYIKRQAASLYRSQRRGGKGRSASALKDEDVVAQLWVVNTHDTLLTFTSAGRVYWQKVHEIPEAGPGARGKPIINLLPLAADERVQAVLPIRDYDGERFVFFSTRNGTVKKTPLAEFAYQLQRGKQAIKLHDDDALIDVALTDGNSDVLLFASNGKVNRFDENTVRAMGRTAAGVRGMRLTQGAHVVSLVVAAEGDILTATERGYGKRTQLAEFTKKGRGTQGVIGIQCSERNGALIGAVQVTGAHELMLISDHGTLVRTRAGEVSLLGRNTQGVTLIRLPEDEKLVSVMRLDAENGNDAADGDDDAVEGAEVPPGTDAGDGVQPDQPQS
jgi:DNA gyrase subunit A